MGRFSKNFLPIFFNVYSQQPAAGESGAYRMAVLDTIKVYLTVTPAEVSLLVFCRTVLCVYGKTILKNLRLVVFHAELIVFERLGVMLQLLCWCLTNENDHPQMVCTFLQKATDRLGSTETTEFTR